MVTGPTTCSRREARDTWPDLRETDHRAHRDGGSGPPARHQPADGDQVFLFHQPRLGAQHQSHTRARSPSSRPLRAATGTSRVGKCFRDRGHRVLAEPAQANLGDVSAPGAVWALAGEGVGLARLCP